MLYSSFTRMSIRGWESIRPHLRRWHQSPTPGPQLASALLILSLSLEQWTHNAVRKTFAHLNCLVVFFLLWRTCVADHCDEKKMNTHIQLLRRHSCWFVCLRSTQLLCCLFDEKLSSRKVFVDGERDRKPDCEKALPRKAALADLTGLLFDLFEMVRFAQRKYLLNTTSRSKNVHV